MSIDWWVAGALAVLFCLWILIEYFNPRRGADHALVFALEFTYWNAPSEADGTEVVARPTLTVFLDADLAASSYEGINIIEGGLWFFAADGSPLEAVFSEQPSVNPDQLTYRAGKYFLRPGSRKSLREVIIDRSVAPRMVVRIAASNSVARDYGWEDAEEVRWRVERYLEAAIPDLAKPIEFEFVADLGG